MRLRSITLLEHAPEPEILSKMLGLVACLERTPTGSTALARISSLVLTTEMTTTVGERLSGPEADAWSTRMAATPARVAAKVLPSGAIAVDLSTLPCPSDILGLLLHEFGHVVHGPGERMLDHSTVASTMAELFWAEFIAERTAAVELEAGGLPPMVLWSIAALENAGETLLVGLWESADANEAGDADRANELAAYSIRNFFHLAGMGLGRRVHPGSPEDAAIIGMAADARLRDIPTTLLKLDQVANEVWRAGVRSCRDPIDARVVDAAGLLVDASNDLSAHGLIYDERPDWRLADAWRHF